MHDILMITYNRPGYTRLALGRLLDSCDETMRVWIWHNGNDQATLDVVKSFSGHPRFHRFHHCPENKRLREPTNWFWANSDGELLTKVDDDCMLPDGWGATLAQTHAANPELGAIGCWRFYDEDYVPELAEKKMISLQGGHRLMKNCWVQGSGYVMKREMYRRLGPIRSDESFYTYCIRGANEGFVHGWYFPFIHEEHMDDPRSPFCELKTDEDFLRQRPLSAVNDNVNTLREWGLRVKFMARKVQESSNNPRDYVGWRKKVRNFSARISGLFGKKDSWRDA